MGLSIILIKFHNPIPTNAALSPFLLLPPLLEFETHVLDKPVRSLCSGGCQSSPKDRIKTQNVSINAELSRNISLFDNVKFYFSKHWWPISFKFASCTVDYALSRRSGNLLSIDASLWFFEVFSQEDEGFYVSYNRAMVGKYPVTPKILSYVTIYFL